jgi:hypothetical protein
MSAEFQEMMAAGDDTFHDTQKRLKKSPSLGTCAALCKRVNATIERKIERLQKEGAGIACAAGCNFCCYLRVSIAPHEAIALYFHSVGNRANRTGGYFRAGRQSFDPMASQTFDGILSISS